MLIFVAHLSQLSIDYVDGAPRVPIPKRNTSDLWARLLLFFPPIFFIIYFFLYDPLFGSTSVATICLLGQRGVEGGGVLIPSMGIAVHRGAWSYDVVRRKCKALENLLEPFPI